jgi:hypothetical protein
MTRIPWQVYFFLLVVCLLVLVGLNLGWFEWIH